MCCSNVVLLWTRLISDSLTSPARPFPRALAVLPVGAVEDEEVALAAVGLRFLVDEGQVAVGERLPPLVPVDALQVAATLVRPAREIKAQHARLAIVAAGRRSRLGLPTGRPVFDHLAGARGQSLPVPVAALARSVDPVSPFSRVG